VFIINRVFCVFSVFSVFLDFNDFIGFNEFDDLRNTRGIVFMEAQVLNVAGVLIVNLEITVSIGGVTLVLVTIVLLLILI